MRICDCRDMQHSNSQIFPFILSKTLLVLLCRLTQPNQHKSIFTMTFIFLSSACMVNVSLLYKASFITKTMQLPAAGEEEERNPEISLLILV